MDKVRSIKILRNCIEKIRNASDAEKEEMVRVYEKYDKSDYEETDINNLKEGENMATHWDKGTKQCVSTWEQIPGTLFWICQVEHDDGTSEFIICHERSLEELDA